MAQRPTTRTWTRSRSPCATPRRGRTSRLTAPGAPTSRPATSASTPLNLNATTTNWSYTTPFNLKPGAYTFTVRATDDLGLSTSSTNRGSLTINVQNAGRRAAQRPDQQRRRHRAAVADPGPGRHGDRRLRGGSRRAGGAGGHHQPLPPAERLDGHGVTRRCPRHSRRRARPAPPGARRSCCRARATGASRRMPSTLPTSRTRPRRAPRPATRSTLVTRLRSWMPNLLTPKNGAMFTDGRIFVSGRVEDDRQIARAQVAISEQRRPVHELERDLRHHDTPRRGSPRS